MVGKMQHIFMLVDNLYVDEFYSETAAAALEKGTAWVKVDGANHMVSKSDSGTRMYQRYDSNPVSAQKGISICQMEE